MAISKQRKDELVAQYIDLINNSKAIFVTDYTGMTVKSMEKMRREIRDANGAFHVIKNTLLKHALEETNKPVPEELFLGQVATGFAIAEVPSLAKKLVDLAKDEEHLTLKGAIFGEDILSVEDVEALAKLPSLPEVRSQIIGLINTPAQNLAGVVASAVRQVVNVIDAYAKSEEGAEAPA